MINIFYNSNDPIMLCGIEFRKNKVANISKEKLEELRKNSYFSSREKTIFKVITKEEVKQKDLPLFKKEEKKEEVKEVEKPKKTRKKKTEIKEEK